MPRTDSDCRFGARRARYASGCFPNSGAPPPARLLRTVERSEHFSGFPFTTGPDSMQNSEFIRLLASRRSQGPKMQRAPAPDGEALRAAALAALAAPRHGERAPARFVRIVSRERLADAFEAALPADADAEARAHARSKALKGECLIAVVGLKPGEDAREAMELRLAQGGALANFLNALFAAGFAAKTVSARSLEAEGLLDPAREELLCFILCGTPVAPAKPRAEAAPLLSDW